MEGDAARRSIPLSVPVWANAARKLGRWLQRMLTARRSRRLRVCETLSLGERRFVAIIEFDRQEFLVGGGGNSFSLLARLQEGRVIPEVSLSQEPLPLPGRANNL